VSVRDLAATATTLAYGTSCCGTSVFPPFIASVGGQPLLGNAGLAIGVGGGFPQRLAVLAMSLAPASIPLGTCEVLLADAPTMLPSGLTDLDGFASTPFPVPANSSLAGLTVHGQYLVLDPNGHFLGFASLTEGLAVTLD
jgi:hypothetical protein